MPVVAVVMGAALAAQQIRIGQGKKGMPLYRVNSSVNTIGMTAAV
jgi:hypothetical protein